jgi:putative ABC transport system permease protein
MAYPPEFRLECGAEMVETLSTREADYQQQPGMIRRVRFRIKELLAVVRTGLGLRVKGSGMPNNVTQPPRAPRRRARASILDTLRQDIRCAVRQLVKDPTFTATVVAILAIGVGANTAVFSVFRSVFLEPLAYDTPSQLVALRHSERNGAECCGPLSGPDYLDFRESSETFSSISLFSSASANLTGGDDEPEQVLGGLVTVGMFEMLGVRPVLGRTFLPREEELGAPVAILSNDLWNRRFDADPGVVGTAITLNREPHTVVGVMPPGFDMPSPYYVGRTHQVYWPLSKERLQDGRGGHWLLGYGRLKEGVTLEAAGEEMAAITGALAEQYPDTNEGKGVRLIDLHEWLFGWVGGQLLVLLGAAGFMLLIVCGNVASLLLARATTRQTEMAIRAAVGASRGRIVRQLLTEGLIVSLVGGAAGVLLAVWGVGVLSAAIPSSIPRIDALTVDRLVLFFALGLSIVTGILFGLAPALTASRANLTESLKEGKGGWSGRSAKNPLRSALVIGQFGLAVLLATSAALMVKSYWRFRDSERGFVAENVLTARLTLQGPQYEDAGRRYAFYRAAIERIGGLPGVTAVGATSKLPLGGGTNTRVWAEDDPERPMQGGGPLIELSRVVSDYFPAMGIELLAGRYLTDQDTVSASPGAIINEEMARRLWPGEDPLGKRFSRRWDTPVWTTVVGVVRNVRQWSLYRPAISEMYLPYPTDPTHWFFLTVRTAGDPLSVASAVRREVFALDPDQPLAEVQTMEGMVEGALAGQRFNTILTGLFAGIALLLVAAGIYGVMSYFVARGTHEIGIRIALGGGRPGVLKLVLRRGLKLALLGAGVGIIAVFASIKVIAAMVFGVSPADALTVGAGAVFIILVGLLGSLIPAHRATRVSPLTALRSE